MFGMFIADILIYYVFYMPIHSIYLSCKCTDKFSISFNSVMTFGREQDITVRCAAVWYDVTFCTIADFSTS